MRTRASELFGIEHPVALGGMASGTSPELVVGVSNGGGLGMTHGKTETFNPKAQTFL